MSRDFAQSTADASGIRMICHYPMGLNPAASVRAHSERVDVVLEGNGGGGLQGTAVAHAYAWGYVWATP